MFDLPDLALIGVFQHLGLVDLARMRLVSRRWKRLIDRQERDELVLSNADYQCEQRWFHTDREMNLEQMLKLDVLESDFLLFNKFITQLRPLSSLRRLRIRKFPEKELYNEWAGDLLCRLVKFVALEQLEIEFGLPEFGCKLVHPNLRILAILDAWIGPEQDIEIDCPRLQVLRCPADYDQLTIVYPEMIRHLYNVRFWSDRSDPADPSNYSDLAVFTNLESFLCHDLFHANANILDRSPKLKELRLETNRTVLESESIRRPNAKSTLLELIEKKAYLGRDELRIHFDGRECSSVEQLKENHSDLFEYDYLGSDYEPSSDFDHKTSSD